MIGHFKSAVFCMEEVFMAKPFYHTHCTKLAEYHTPAPSLANSTRHFVAFHCCSLCYSAGDMDAARSYYSMSLQLKPTGNLRAIWGLALATSQSEPPLGAKDADADVDALNDIAVRKLIQEYDASKNPDLAKVVRGWAQR